MAVHRPTPTDSAVIRPLSGRGRSRKAMSCDKGFLGDKRTINDLYILRKYRCARGVFLAHMGGIGIVQIVVDRVASAKYVP